MALVTTTGAFTQLYNAFTGLSATERSQSGIARAEIVYYNVNDNWGAPGAGNNRVYQTGLLSLPKDFGYVLTDAFCRIQVDAASSEVSASSVLRLFPGGILGPQINLTLTADPDKQDVNGSTAIGDIPANRYNTIKPTSSGNDGVVIHTLRNKTTALLYPFASNTYTSDPNPSTDWDWAIGEELSNGVAYDVSCYFRFLQYDIDQSYNYVVQSPQLTR